MPRYQQTFVDQYTGKQYWIASGQTTKVKQFSAHAVIDESGHSENGYLSTTDFKNRIKLKSWLRMMSFEK